ncbi:HAT, C-terminal dimerization domain [Dillenia turbinata]|uniref:HAT, C-terminal dimerization domain n=1 Tax=Dillenia turbinata TaxID=194707 RepID=A0AAN8ZBA5_9MAGN
MESLRCLYCFYLENSPKMEEYFESFSSESEEYESEEEMDLESDSNQEQKLEHPKTVHKECCKSFNYSLQKYYEYVGSDAQPTKSDLDLYLEEPVLMLPWTQDFNILRWWRVASTKYPVLSRMARDILAIPFSIATSYEAYYTTERHVDEGVISIKTPKLLNALLCTRSWSSRQGLSISILAAAQTINGGTGDEAQS